MSPPVLIGCPHGTRSPTGQAVIARVLAEVESLAAQRLTGGVPVAAAFVDVQQPTLAQVVASIMADESASAVVVPVLLSGGFHVHTDIAAATTPTAGRLVATPALGPDPRLADVLVDRLAQSGVDPDRPVVLAAAGSSDPRAQRDVAAIAEALQERRAGRVSVGYGAAAAPTVADAVAAAGGDRAAVASYLLAPGHFHDLVCSSGAGVVTEPLAPHPLLAEIVLERYLAVVDT